MLLSLWGGTLFRSRESHIEALKGETLDAMFVQDPFRIGNEAVQSLTESSLDGRLDLPAPMMIVKADLAKPEIQALLFPEWLKAT